MAANLIHAPFRELEDALARGLAGHAEADALRPSLLLVPHRLLARHLTRSLARRLGGWIGLESMTLGRFAHEIAAPHFARRRAARLTADGEELLMARAIEETLRAGHPLHALRAQPGSAHSLRGTLRELGEALFAPDDLDRLARVETIPAVTRERLRGLASLWRAYRARLEARSSYDGLDALRAAPELLSARGTPVTAWCARYRAAFLYGFFHLKPAERELVTALARVLDVTAFFPRAPEGGSGHARDTLSWLRAQGFAEDARARTAMGPEAPNSPPAAPVRVLAAAAEEDEVREAMRLRLRPAAGGSIAGSCAFLYHDRAAYEPLVRDVARECGVRVATDGRAGAQVASGAHAAQLFLRLRADGASRLPGRDAVMEFASAAPLHRDLADRDIATTSADAWDRETRFLGIRRGSDWRAGSLSPSLGRFIGALEEALGGIPDRGRWQVLAAGMEQACARLLMPDAAAALRETWAGLAALDRVDDGTHFAEFARHAHRALARVVVSAPSDGPGAAATWSAELSAAAGVPADVVVILGLVEGGLPRHPRGDPLLPDTERARVNQALREMGETARALPLRTSGLERERLSFALAVAGAREKVVLTYARTDPARDRERLPSPFLLELFASATGEPASYEGFASWAAVHRFALAGTHQDPEGALDRGEFDRAIVRASLAAGTSGIPRLRAFFALRPGLRERVAAQRARWGVDELSAHVGWLGSDACRLAIEEAHRGAMSASRLRGYAFCPQSYFLAHLLGLREWKEPERRSEPDPRDRGQLYHEILRDFVTAVMREAITPWSHDRLDEYRRLMERIIARHFAEARARPGGGLFLHWEDEERRVRDDMERWLREELEDAAGFEPCEVELDFGKPPDPAVAVRAGEESMELRGRIDRVDITRDRLRARIIDYKTGKATVNSDDPLEGGRAIQLPLYALAAEEILRARFPGLEVTEAALYGVSQSRGFGRQPLAAAVWQERAPELGRVCRTLTGGMRAGFYAPLPLPGRRGCPRCDFRRVCGPAMDRIGERIGALPAARAFSALRGAEDEEAEA